MKDIGGILFDKDGTLFHYGRVWGPITDRHLVSGLSIFPRMTAEARQDLAFRLERLIGVDRNAAIYPGGFIFRPKRIWSAIMKTFLLGIRYSVNPFRLIKMIDGAMERLPETLAEELKDCDFSEGRNTLRALHDMGYRIGIVTSDNSGDTSIFIRSMGIGEYVDFVRTGDSPDCRKKPHPDAMLQFCGEFGLEPENVCVVGDSMGDFTFADNAGAGYRIAVLTGQNDLPLLKEMSDAVYPSIGHILEDGVMKNKRIPDPN